MLSMRLRAIGDGEDEVRETASSAKPNANTNAMNKKVRAQAAAATATTSKTSALLIASPPPNKCFTHPHHYTTLHCKE